MASQETPNYRLSRWAGTDRILVEEFNNNWDKIDTALKGNMDASAEMAAACPIEKLLDITLEENSKAYDIDVSKIDFTQYRRIEVDASIANSANPVRIRVNGMSSGYLYTSSNVSSSSNASYLGVAGSNYNCILTPPKSGCAIGCWNTSWNGYGCTHWYCTSGVTWDALTSLTLVPVSGTLSAGTKFRLYGIKA